MTEDDMPPTEERQNEAHVGNEPAETQDPNYMTLIAIIFGMPSECLWLAMFLGAGIDAPATGIALGLVGSACGAMGLSQALRDKQEEGPSTAILGLLCPVIGLAISVMMALSVFSVTRDLSETTDFLSQAIEELSAIDQASAPDEAPSGSVS